MTADDKQIRVGSTLESLLREDGTYEELKNDAIEVVVAYKPTAATET